MFSKTVRVNDKSEAGKLIQVSPFRKNIRTTQPHTHNGYFEIIFLSKGSGYHTIDTVQYAIDGPVIFFVRKEQVHHWNLDDEADGYVLMLQRGFVVKSLDGVLRQLLGEVSFQSCVRLTDHTNIDSVFSLLCRQELSIDDQSFHVVEGLLKALLAMVIQVSVPTAGTQKKKSGLYEKFRELLSQKSSVKNTVAYYAKELNTTPQNLNAICRKAVNESAADVLSDTLISEAKRLLLYTDKTASEISFILGFNDPSHFVKYFKKITGYTPGSFRSR